MKSVRLIFNSAAALCLILGGVWVLQGIGVLPGSFMTGETEWAVYGGLLILVALAALVRAGLELFTELPATAERTVVLFTDLHAGNVLRAERAPWLAIDPKPFVGDPAYDATQHLFNCLGRMQRDPLATIASFADRLGLSRERVRLWTFARAAAEPRGRWSENPWLEVARRIAP